jgi:hypothetical protein
MLSQAVTCCSHFFFREEDSIKPNDIYTHIYHPHMYSPPPTHTHAHTQGTTNDGSIHQKIVLTIHFSIRGIAPNHVIATALHQPTHN